MSAISIITPIGLGALHVLEPGYGKTSMALYSKATLHSVNFLGNDNNPIRLSLLNSCL